MSDSLLTTSSKNVSDWPQHARQHVAGVDEAGRGPLAGAVFAAAVILPACYQLPGLTDSKKLSAARRTLLYDLICEQAIAFAVTEVSAAEIDQLNIFRASLLAMHNAVDALGVDADFVFVDGTHCPPWHRPAAALVKGDSRLDCIAAASVLAKVARDREMLRLHAEFPVYGFNRHKGYPTPEHLAALAQYGPCPQHRRSYAPVAKCLAGH